MRQNNQDVHFAYLLFLSLVAGLGGFLFGYDTAVVSGTNQQVALRFGLDEMQLGWYVGCALIGSIGGVAIAGELGDRFGRKRTMLFAAVIFCLSAVGCALSVDFTTLVLSRILVGVGIGVISIVSPLYISEIAVDRYRGSLVSLYQLGITFGIVAAYGVNHLLLGVAERGMATMPAAGTPTLFEQLFYVESWRAMLGFCALPAILFFGVLFLIPESPRWLLLRERTGDADRVLRCIYAHPEEADSQRLTILQLLEETRRMEEGKWSYLMRPAVLKLVAVGSAIAILGQFMGVNAVLYYGPKIFSEAGFDNPMFSTVLVGLVNFATTVLAVFIIDRVGRKQLIYWGVSGMIICLMAIGTYFATGGALGSGFMLAFFLAYVFCCAISISAIVFVLLSEMYPNSIRGRAMSLAGFMLWVGTYLVGQLTPVLLEWSQAGTFFIFAVMCVPYMLIMWKVIPETTGKTLEEIEEYWTKR